MKIKDRFILQQIADEFIVVPIAEEAERINGIIKLNDEGAFLWRFLEKKDYTEEELVNLLVTNYHINIEVATEYVEDYLKTLKKLGCLVS